MTVRIKDGIIEAVTGAHKGWTTKYKKRAEFWEAEARRLGSTAEYKMIERRTNKQRALDELDAIVATMAALGGMSQATARESVDATLRSFEQPTLFDLGAQPCNLADDPKIRAFMDEAPSVLCNFGHGDNQAIREYYAAPTMYFEAPEAPKVAWDMTESELQQGYAAHDPIEPEPPKDPMVGRKCWARRVDRVGVIVGVIKNPPDHRFVYKAYHIKLNDDTKITEWARDVVLEDVTYGRGYDD